MKLKTFARRAAAAGAVLAALTLAALPALAAPKVQVSTTNAVADHADILSDETEQYVNDVSIKLSDACGAQIGVYTLDELLGSTTMEGFAYDVFNAWGLGSDDLDNGVLLLLAVLFIPGLNTLFQAAALDMTHLLEILGLAFLPTLIIQIFKLLRGR